MQFVAAAYTDISSTTPGLPSGYQTGDLLLLTIAGGASSSQAPTVTGWTLIGRDDVIRLAFYARTASGTSADQPVLSGFGGPNNWGEASTAAYRGASRITVQPGPVTPEAIASTVVYAPTISPASGYVIASVIAIRTTFTAGVGGVALDSQGEAVANSWQFGWAHSATRLSGSVTAGVGVSGALHDDGWGQAIAVPGGGGLSMLV